jgi:DNA-binding CsgD family transcriptional regulator
VTVRGAAVRARRLPASVHRRILDQLALAVFVFRERRLEYQNEAARRLVARLRQRYRIELVVLLNDHLSALGRPAPRAREPVVSLLTAHGGEPFHLHVLFVSRAVMAVSVREVGADMESFRLRYHLSRREAQVAELVLHGYRNREIATRLEISTETAKKHLTRVFDKVGVHSRVQLANRLA